MPPGGGQGPRKIASIGVHVSRWVTTHGYALNVDLDPAPFTEWITACGLDDAAFTTMAHELERPIGVEEVGLLRSQRSRRSSTRVRRAPADTARGSGHSRSTRRWRRAERPAAGQTLPLDQACARSVRGGGRPRRLRELAEDVGDMPVHGARSATTSDEAISRLESPAATSRSTSVSRRDSGESPLDSTGTGPREAGERAGARR